MKRILVFSDSHGNIENLESVVKKTKNIDMLIHLGDIQGDENHLQSICNYPVHIVRGNCDFSSNLKMFLTIEVENHKIFAAHGHTYGVDWGIEKISYAALELGCDIAMYGHTHVPEVIVGDDITVINPGSISRPRQYNYKPSYILMEIDKNGEVQCYINYLEKK